jgi:valyl-tRNA synthetase
MPFLTEELWQRLAEGVPGRPISIALARYPEHDSDAADAEAERDMELLRQIVVSARNLRAELKLDPKQQVEAVVYSPGAAAEIARRHCDVIDKLAGVRLEVRSEDAPAQPEGVLRSTPEFDVVLRVPAAQLEARRARLEKEIERLEKLIAGSRAQLSDETFLARAPAQVVNSIREKLADYEAQLAKSREALGR